MMIETPIKLFLSSIKFYVPWTKIITNFFFRNVRKILVKHQNYLLCT